MERTEKKPVTNHSLLSFSFMLVRWCWKKRESLEVRGGGREWRRGEHAGRREEISLGPSSLPVGLGAGEVPDYVERDRALKGRLKGVPGAAIPPFLRLRQGKYVPSLPPFCVQR